MKILNSTKTIFIIAILICTPTVSLANETKTNENINHQSNQYLKQPRITKEIINNTYKEEKKKENPKTIDPGISGYLIYAITGALVSTTIFINSPKKNKYN